MFVIHATNWESHKILGYFKDTPLEEVKEKALEWLRSDQNDFKDDVHITEVTNFDTIVYEDYSDGSCLNDVDVEKQVWSRHYKDRDK
jgi:hypothetical protein